MRWSASTWTCRTRRLKRQLCDMNSGRLLKGWVFFRLTRLRRLALHWTAAKDPGDSATETIVLSHRGVLQISVPRFPLKAASGELGLNARLLNSQDEIKERKNERRTGEPRMSGCISPQS